MKSADGHFCKSFWQELLRELPPSFHPAALMRLSCSNLLCCPLGPQQHPEAGWGQHPNTHSLSLQILFLLIVFSRTDDCLPDRSTEVVYAAAELCWIRKPVASVSTEWRLQWPRLRLNRIPFRWQSECQKHSYSPGIVKKAKAGRQETRLSPGVLCLH